MIIDNYYVINPEDAEEVKAANEAILKIREQRIEIKEEGYKQEQILKAKLAISFAISDSISSIGLAETKNLVRKLNKELRKVKEA